MNRFVQLLGFSFIALGSSAPVHAELRAGAARGNITPAIGTVINGGTAPVISTHVHDELWARALVLDDGPTRLAIVVIDSCLVERAVTWRGRTSFLEESATVKMLDAFRHLIEKVR